MSINELKKLSPNSQDNILLTRKRKSAQPAKNEFDTQLITNPALPTIEHSDDKYYEMAGPDFAFNVGIPDLTHSIIQAAINTAVQAAV